MTRHDPAAWLLAAALMISACGGGSAGSATATVSTKERYQNAALGFGITKPSGWFFVSAEENREQRANISFGSDELDEQIRRRARDPIVSMTKYEETGRVNPTINVVYRPLRGIEGRSAHQVAEAIAAQMDKTLDWFELEGSVVETTVAGHPAGYYATRYTVQSERGAFQIRSQTWVIPMGSNVFLIGMSGAPEGVDAANAEFRRALQSISLRDR